jgi:hypothetical protein
MPTRPLIQVCMVGVFLSVSAAPHVIAQSPSFRCSAGDQRMECPFSVEHPDGTGATNFVLNPGETHGLNRSVIGAKYCVTVRPKHTGGNLKWPECWAASGSRRVKAPPAVND